MSPRIATPLARFALAALGLASAGALFFEAGPNDVIYPKQRIPLKFDHAFHLREADEAKGITGAGLGCDDCHESVATSSLAADRNLPNHEVCEDCHEVEPTDDPAQSQCTWCHGDLEAKTTTVAAKMWLPAPNIIFSHERHLAADVKCLDCHKNVPERGLATRADLPTMDRCVECHDERGAAQACTTCHLSTHGGRMVSKYPEGELKPARLHVAAIHDPDFLHDHAAPAQRDPTYCSNCHEQKDCLTCHDGVARDMRYHPGDWIAQHPLRARHDDFRCQSCHRFQSFCIDCHVRTGIAGVGTDVSVGFERGTVRRTNNVPQGPHPMTADGWLDPGSRNFHGFHAQRNIRACVACHQEQYCISCHGSAFATGSSFGGNPHGPNPQRLKGSTASKRNARACLKCHDPSDPAWR